MINVNNEVDRDDDDDEARRRRLLEDRLEQLLLRQQQQDDEEDEPHDGDNDSHRDDDGAGGVMRGEEGEGEGAANDDNDAAVPPPPPHRAGGAPVNDDDDDPMMDEAEPLLGDPLVNEGGMVDDQQAAPLSRPPALSYVNVSFLVAISWFYYAMRSRQQFYLAVVYLASSKLSLAILGNACIALAISAFETFVSIFLEGGLRLQEAEGLQDFFRWNVTETCLALTMFRSEINIQTTVEFLVLIWIKCVHHVAGLRENHFRMTQEAVAPVPVLGGRLHIPTVPKPYIKLFCLLLFLQMLDVAVFQHASNNLNDNGPSVNILFKFETIILLVSAWRHALLLHLHLWDGLLQHAHDHSWFVVRRLLHPWKEYRATLVFAVDLQAQAFQFLFYMAFFGTVLTFYGMPINLFREVYMSFAALKERVLAFLKYRKLMGRMNRFDSATAAQLEESGHVCIICRDDMHPRDSKVLPGCGHMFHKSCLREWLVQQQTCPTCRSDIDEMASRQAQRQQAAHGAEGRRGEPEAGVQVENVGNAAPPPEPAQSPVPRPAEAAPVEGSVPSASSVAHETSALAAGAGAAPADRLAAPPDRPSRPVSSEASRTEGQHLQYPQMHPPPQPVSPWGQLVPSQPTYQPPPPRRPWNFPSLYRVASDDGTSIWRDEHDKEGPGFFGSSTGTFSRFVRLLDCGTVVLCTEVASDSDGTLFLRVPDGWINQEDVVHVMDLVTST